VEAYVIMLEGNEYSEQVADRCVETAEEIGRIEVEQFGGFTRDEADDYLAAFGLRWTWGKGGAGMKHHSYGGDEKARIACALSHFALWMYCQDVCEPIMVLEHDAVFVRQFEPFDFESACMINDPKGATPRGDWWHDRMVERGPGVWPKTRIFDDSRPDGLAGNSAYVLQPTAATRLIEVCQEYGLWPNDAILCRQMVPGLQEHYPFITEARPGRSTIQFV